jgi:hypothetical protein
MKEMYWIMVYGNLSTTITIVLILGIIAIIALSLGVFCCYDDEIYCGLLKKWLKKSALIVLLTFPFMIFMPSRNELYQIIGVGKILDYVQENKNLQELPDKCIHALDAWVESLNK